MATRTLTLLSGATSTGAGSELDTGIQPGTVRGTADVSITISGTATVAIEYWNGTAWTSAGSLTSSGMLGSITIYPRMRANVTAYTDGTCGATISISFMRGGDPNY